MPATRRRVKEKSRAGRRAPVSAGPRRDNLGAVRPTARIAVLALLALLASACASEAPHPEPKRSAEGLPITGRPPYDAFFQGVRRIEARSRELVPLAEALSVPVAVALELPLSAPTEDLAAALGKSLKRCARLGITVRIVVDATAPGGARVETSGDGTPPAALLPGFEAVATALTAARALCPGLEEATGRAEALHTEGLRLERATPSDFARRGSAYTRAVACEMADANHQVDDTREALRVARDHVRDFLDRLAVTTAPPNGRVQQITPGLTSP